MRPLLALVVLTACAPESSALPAGQLALPDFPLAIEPAEAVPGDVVTITVSGAPANVDVTIGVSSGTDPGALCPGPLGGSCLDLQAPVTLVLTATTDASGDLVREFTVPDVPVATYTMQAASRVAGSAALISSTATLDVCEGTVFYADLDGDGYGDPNTQVVACAAPDDFVDNDDDCDDDRFEVSPDAVESCSGTDSDCDGVVDFGVNVPDDFATVQDAVDAAPDGGTVCVGAGTWSDNLTIETNVTVASIDGADSTILDGGGSGRTVLLDGGTGTLRGFTITGGSSASGAGVRVTDGTWTIEEVVVTGNTASGSRCNGVGLDLTTSGHTTLRDVEVHGNDLSCSSTFGSMLYLDGGSQTLERVMVVDNTVETDGSTYGFVGMYAPSATISNLVVANNVTTARDGANDIKGCTISSFNAGSADLSQVDLVGNTCDPGTGFLRGTAAFNNTTTTVVNATSAFNNDGGASANTSWNGGDLTIAYTNVFEGTANATGVTAGDGMLQTDPLYTDITAASARDWDLTLQAGSPLVDAGDPAILDADGSESDIGSRGGPTAW
jgi:hypothetical protein